MGLPSSIAWEKGENPQEGCANGHLQCHRRTEGISAGCTAIQSVEERPGVQVEGSPGAPAHELGGPFLGACVSSSSCVGVCVWHQVVSGMVLKSRVVHAVGHGVGSWEWEERAGRAG